MQVENLNLKCKTTSLTGPIKRWRIHLPQNEKQASGRLIQWANSEPGSGDLQDSKGRMPGWGETRLGRKVWARFSAVFYVKVNGTLN